MAGSKLRLGCSPISNTVYCGRVRQLKSGQLIWTSKEDVTSDFLNAVVEMMSAERNRNGLYIGTETNPKEFVLTMEKVGEQKNDEL